jgi:hypothetical protein
VLRQSRPTCLLAWASIDCAITAMRLLSQVNFILLLQDELEHIWEFVQFEDEQA